MRTRNLFAAGLAALALGGLFAAAPAKAETTRQRLRDEQHRINRGHRNGQITDGEYRRLNRQERVMRREWRAEHRGGGVMSPSDRASMDSQLDLERARIYRARHNRHHH